MTAIPYAAGSEVLLAALEGGAACIVRVDPLDTSESTDLDLEGFLAWAWGMRVNNTIAAYNEMAPLHECGRGNLLAFGLMAFIARNQPVPAGHNVVDVGTARPKMAHGTWCAGRMDITICTASLPISHRRSAERQAGLRLSLIRT